MFSAGPAFGGTEFFAAFLNLGFLTFRERERQASVTYDARMTLVTVYQG